MPLLRNFEDPACFRLDRTGDAILFRVRSGDPRMKGETFPRSELRELSKQGDGPAAWSTGEGLVHTLSISLSFTRLPRVGSRQRPEPSRRRRRNIRPSATTGESSPLPGRRFAPIVLAESYEPALRSSSSSCSRKARRIYSPIEVPRGLAARGQGPAIPGRMCPRTHARIGRRGPLPRRGLDFETLSDPQGALSGVRPCHPRAEMRFSRHASGHARHPPAAHRPLPRPRDPGSGPAQHPLAFRRGHQPATRLLRGSARHHPRTSTPSPRRACATRRPSPPAGVCAPCRSGIITGMYQNTRSARTTCAATRSCRDG